MSNLIFQFCPPLQRAARETTGPNKLNTVIYIACSCLFVCLFVFWGKLTLRVYKLNFLNHTEEIRSSSDGSLVKAVILNFKFQYNSNPNYTAGVHFACLFVN